MDVIIGFSETIIILLICFVLATFYYGRKVSNKIYHDDLENITKERDYSQRELGYFDEDSDSHYYTAIVKNGWRIAFVICATLFNVIYPILNSIFQISLINLEYIKANFSLYAISGISFYLIINGLMKLKSITTSLDSFNLGEGSKNKQKQILYFSLRQFLIYSIAINYCLMLRDNESSILYQLVIFFTILTIDDWMLLFKYLDIITVEKLKTMDLYKLLSYNIIIPVIIYISVIKNAKANGTFENSSIDIGSDVYGIWLLIGLPLLIMWIELLYENIVMIKNNT
ncbi:hypothetical protein [Psychroserpens algicola]|uniref:DUF4271 domain-containing protein n=1 Tax=Psychroserpens algicola TaxID=1719034 RepID=A0ABT0HBH0_9FLAO|nr:hypothetical protein [Psychroserpens algicola]MCK8481696.1 hypothetical protein [Psychroserpens algicola]